MSDNENTTTAKTRGLGKISVSKLGKLKQWKAYEAASKASAEADKALMTAKQDVRTYLKGILGLDDETVIDFSKNTDGTVTVYERLEVKAKRAKASSLLDDLIK